jgi:hypothetical protein
MKEVQPTHDAKTSRVKGLRPIRLQDPLLSSPVTIATTVIFT